MKKRQAKKNAKKRKQAIAELYRQADIGYGDYVLGGIDWFRKIFKTEPIAEYVTVRDSTFHLVDPSIFDDHDPQCPTQ